MLNTTTFESRLAIVQAAVQPATAKPPTSKDRAPRLHNKETSSNQCFTLGFKGDTKALKQDLAAHRLWKSMIHLLGNFLEKSPDANKFPRLELRKFIDQMEICLGVREGKLNAAEYGNVLIKLDALYPYVDGVQHDEDVRTIEKIILMYGAKLEGKDQ